MTKVLMITNRFIYGGIEKLLLDIFENKSDPSIKYDLLTLTTEKDDELIDRIKACKVGYYSLELDNHNALERQIYHYKALYNFVKKGKYDVVHINITSYARVMDMMMVKKAGTRKRIIHSHSAAERDPWHRKLIRPARKLYDYSATDFFACSPEAAKHLFSNKIYKNEEYRIIKNGIQVEKYLYSEDERKRIRDTLGIGDNVLLIGHIGRLTEAKNHTFILDVFNEIIKQRKDAKLLLVGDGELRCEIEAKISNLGIEDSIIMYGASADTSALLSAMDIFLFPSIWEGLGISAVEAQCNGLPCYLSDRIPETAIITSNAIQLDISKGANVWSEVIINNEYNRVREEDAVMNAGYDISHTIRSLEELYKSANV